MALSWFENVFCFFLLAGGRGKGEKHEQASWDLNKKKIVLEIRNAK